MKPFMENESAGSMIILIIATSIFFFGLFYVVMSYTYNVPIGAMNQLITDGAVTKDTADAFNLCLNMWKASPFFMLLGLILYCYERGKGTDIPAGTFFEYLFLMMIGLIVSSYFVYAFGLALDGITLNLDNSILTDHSAEWDTVSERTFLTKMLYYFSFLPSFITAILYMLHPIIKQKETGYVAVSEDDEYSEIPLGQY